MIDAGGENASLTRGGREFGLLFTVATGTFMAGVDGSVASLVLPVITRAFRSDVATTQWVVTAYLLVVSGLLLIFGRLGDLFGHRPVYLSGLGIFLIGAALCAIAPTVGMLIAFRGLEGAGAAMLYASAPAIVGRSAPASRRGRALGSLSAAAYIGLTLGPAVAGWVMDRWSWRAAFLINIPVGLLALAFGVRNIPRDAPEGAWSRFDLAGSLTFIFGLVTLLLALNQAPSWGWASPGIWALLGAALVSIVLFTLIEGRIPAPMLDLALFRNRLFSASVMSAVLNYVAVFCLFFLAPFYLIQGRGLRPAAAGLVLTSLPFVMAIVSPFSGTISDRIGSRIPGTAGMTVLAAGLFYLSTLGAEAPLTHVVLALAVTGLGTAVFISPNSSALLGSVPRDRQGIASGVVATARYVGMALGVGLAGTIFTTVLAGSGLSESSASIIAAASAGFLAAACAALLGVLTSAVRGR